MRFRPLLRTQPVDMHRSQSTLGVLQEGQEARGKVRKGCRHRMNVNVGIGVRGSNAGNREECEMGKKPTTASRPPNRQRRASCMQESIRTEPIPA